MKTKVLNSGCRYALLLAALLFATFVPAAGAQTLTLLTPSFNRRVLMPFYATDSHVGNNQTYQPYFTAVTNVDGTFNVSNTESTPGSFQELSAACTALQDSIVTATATNLSITGQVEISSSGSAISTQFGIGSASWSGLSEIIIGFRIDRPFAYSLTATTTMNTNSTETVPTALVGLDHNGDASVTLPNIVAYGAQTEPGPALDTAPSAGGTNTGVFDAGDYYFVARVHSSSGVDPDHTPMSEHFLATFNLSVTFIPPQPPVITALTANDAGGFNLIWNAPQAGNYRVLSSADLTAWSELIPAAATSSGLNTNVVSSVPGSSTGFFRVEYLP